MAKKTVLARLRAAEASPVATEPKTSKRNAVAAAERRNTPGYLINRRRRNRIRHGGPLSSGITRDLFFCPAIQFRTWWPRHSP